MGRVINILSYANKMVKAHDIQYYLFTGLVKRLSPGETRRSAFQLATERYLKDNPQVARNKHNKSLIYELKNQSSKNGRA